MRGRPHRTLLWVMCAAVVLVAVWLAVPVFAAVAGEWRVNLVRGSTTQATITGQTADEAWDSCVKRISEQSPSSTQWTCQTLRFVARVVADPPPLPTPVDCVVSDPTWTGPEWSTVACVNGTKTRTETGTRTIITPPANGGTACPALTETRTATQACVVEPPPPPPPSGYTPTKWAVPGGSSTSSCTQAAPCSLLRAMATAVAGDVVSVAGGVHLAPGTNQRHLPAFNPARSGTTTAPIVFFGPRTGTRAELRLSSGAGPTMGTNGRTDIILDGLVVDENFSPSVPDTGPMVVWQSDRIKLRNILCQGAQIRLQIPDNRNCLRLEYARDIEITDGDYKGTVEDGPPGQNTACVMAYDATRVLFRGNRVVDCDVGLFIKGDHGDPNYGLDAWTVQRNRIEGSWTAIHVGGHGASATSSERTLITDNVILSTRRVSGLGGWGVILHVYNSTSPRAITIANNTIVAQDAGIASLGAAATGTALTDIEVRDNIIVSALGLNYGVAPGRGGFTSNYNLVSARVFGGSGGFYADGYPQYATLASWQTAMGLDRNSQSFDPRLTTDYKLPAGSPALTGSSTGGPIGVR